MSMGSTWQALTPWLGSLLSRPDPHIRVNLAMLAADLATGDPDARWALAGMLARTCDAVVRTDAPEERSILKTLMQERSQLPVALREELDLDVSGLLHDFSKHWVPDKAVDILLRGEQPAHFLPASTVADAIVISARQLGGRDLTGPERDVERTRLAQIVSFDRGSRADGQRDIRRAVDERLAEVPRKERRLAIFELMRRAPSLLAPAPDGTRVANAAMLDAAARAGRPKKLWTIWRAVLGAVAGTVLLTMVVAAALELLGPGWAKIQSNGSDIFLLSLLGLLAGLPAAVSFTPSVQRRMSELRKLRHAAWPALVGTALVLWVCLADPLPERLGYSDSSGFSLVSFAVFAAILCIALGVAARLAPEMVRLIRDSGSDGGIGLATFATIGPVIALATLVCGFPLYFGSSTLARFWPVIVVSVSTLGAVTASIELETMPGIGPNGERTRRPVLLPLLSAALGTLPLVIMLIAVLIRSLYAGKYTANNVALDAPHQSFLLDPQQNVKLHNKNGKLLQVKIEIESHQEIFIETESHEDVSIVGDKTPRYSGKKSVLLTDDKLYVLCAGVCKNPDGPGMEDWLAAVVDPIIHVVLDITELPASDLDIALALKPNGMVQLKVEAGVLNTFTVPAGQGAVHFNFAIDAAAASDSGWLTVYSLGDTSGELTKSEIERRPVDLILSSGRYAVCVYFIDSDRAACNPSSPVRTVSKPSVATIDIKQMAKPEQTGLSGTPNK